MERNTITQNGHPCGPNDTAGVRSNHSYGGNETATGAWVVFFRKGRDRGGREGGGGGGGGGGGEGEGRGREREREREREGVI